MIVHPPSSFLLPQSSAASVYSNLFTIPSQILLVLFNMCFEPLRRVLQVTVKPYALGLRLPTSHVVSDEGALSSPNLSECPPNLLRCFLGFLRLINSHSRSTRFPQPQDQNHCFQRVMRDPGAGRLVGLTEGTYFVSASSLLHSKLQAS